MDEPQSRAPAMNGPTMDVPAITVTVRRAPGAGRRSVLPGIATLYRVGDGVSMTYAPNPKPPRVFSGACGCCFGGLLMFAVAWIGAGFVRTEHVLALVAMVAVPIALAWAVDRIASTGWHRVWGKPEVTLIRDSPRIERNILQGGMIERFEVVPRGVRVFFASDAPAPYAGRSALWTPHAPATVEDLVTLLEAIDAP